jgi:hypothetical protein
MQESTKLYVVTRIDTDSDVKVCGVFTSKDEAENAIKNDIFSYITQLNPDSYLTEDIPEFEYTIQIANIIEELR